VMQSPTFSSSGHLIAHALAPVVSGILLLPDLLVFCPFLLIHQENVG
jgi:hypothetical protein